MNIPQPIPYQGSKRNIASYILQFFPYQTRTLVEPFAGSAAVSVAAACFGKAAQFHLNDVNRPLIHLWEAIIHHPERIAKEYEVLWIEQAGRERAYYDEVRNRFNKTQKPADMLYLLARCVKASVRYNSKGEFNQSPDNRRKGRRPENMREDIYAVSNLLRGRTVTTNKDYREVLASVSREDLVYMDPPYQGVCSNRDPRYYMNVDFAEFVGELESLVKRRVQFIVSYDGRTGQKVHGREIPADIGLQRVEVKAGRSTQSTLLGGSDFTYESIYLSPELVKRLGAPPRDVLKRLNAEERTQLALGLME